MIASHVLLSSLAALASALLASTPAEPTIRWESAPACVDATSVPARVGALVGEQAVVAGSLVLAAERRGEAWRISLGLEPLDGAPLLRRTLEGRDCATLTEAVALVIAVHLDAVAMAGGLEREGEQRDGPGVATLGGGPRGAPGGAAAEASDGAAGAGGPREASGEGRPRGPAGVHGAASEPTDARGATVALGEGSSSKRTPGTRDDRSPRPRALASFGVAGEVGVQPRAGAAFELAGGVGWPRARVELGALASVGPDAASEQRADVGGRFRLFTGLVRGCGVPGRERIELPLCGGLELGDLRASGTGLRRPATVDAPWIAVVASARPQWIPRLRSASASNGARARLAVGALLDLVVPLRRHRFATREAGLVHAVDPVAVRLGLRVELRLP